MPGLEKRLARCQQLYSRSGLAHHYRRSEGTAVRLPLEGKNAPTVPNSLDRVETLLNALSKALDRVQLLRGDQV
jgi:hypothetical protein